MGVLCRLMPAPPSSSPGPAAAATSRCRAGCRAARAASRVDSPSSTVSCRTTRSSGEIRAIALPTSTFSSRSSTRSSAEMSWPSLSTQRRPEPEVGALAEPADQPADGDPPQPGRHLAVAAEAGRAVPGGDEGVLEDVGDGVGIGAATGQPGRDPEGVPVVELAEGTLVPTGHRVEQVGVREITGSHTRTVAPRLPNGPRAAELFRRLHEGAGGTPPLTAGRQPKSVAHGPPRRLRGT